MEYEDEYILKEDDFEEIQIQAIKKTGSLTKLMDICKKLEEAGLRFKGLEEKVSKMREEGEIEGRRKKEQIINEAQKEAERIKELTKQDIEIIIQTGIRELKEYTAKIATHLAEERLRKNITPEDHKLLIDRSIQKISEYNEKSNTDKKIRPRAS